MSKCENCHCDCHCDEELHAHHYDGDLCTCSECLCKEVKDEKNTKKYLALDQMAIYKNT